MASKSLYISNFKAVQKITIKIGFFLIPIILVFLFPLGLLFFSGELLGIYDDEPKEIFGLSYSYPVKFFKTKNTNRINPELLVLGSSRAMQFEQKLFSEDLSYYTAGGAINALADFKNYWKNIKVKPKFLIITIDPWWFNKAHDNLKKNYFPIDFQRPGNPIKIFINQWKTVYDDIIAGKIQLKKLVENKNKIGMLAIMKNEGFLADGSYQYSDLLLARSFEKRASSYLKAAKNKGKRFEICKQINTPALDLFFNFINEINKTMDSTQLFIIQPSMAETILEELDPKEHANYYYLKDSIQARLKNTSLENNYFYSISNADRGMIDGIHPRTETIAKDLQKFATGNKHFLNLLKSQ